MLDLYHDGYETATQELELLKHKYRGLLADVDFCEGFFDAVSDFTGD